MRFRFLFGWGGGLLILLLAYGVFLADAMLAREGYWQLWPGRRGADRGLGDRLGAGPAPLGRRGRPTRGPPPFRLARRVRRNPRMPVASGVPDPAGRRARLAYTSQGITFSIVQLSLPVRLAVHAAALARSIRCAVRQRGRLLLCWSAPLHRRWGKRDTAMRRGGAGHGVLGHAARPAPLRAVVDRRIDAAIDRLFAPTFFVANMFSVVTMISVVLDGRRRGRGFARARPGGAPRARSSPGNFFMQKCATGLGIFFTGLMREPVAGCPSEAKPGEVAREVIDTLALAYAACVAVLAMLIGADRAPLPDHAARTTRRGWRAR